MVKYTAKKSGVLKRVATFVNHPNTALQAFVCRDFDEDALELSTFVDSSKLVNADFAGYYSFDLTNQVWFEEGESFYVVMKYFAPNENLPMPVESKIPKYAYPILQSGKCWINPDIKRWPNTWHACGADAENPNLRFNLCIRVELISE